MKYQLKQMSKMILVLEDNGVLRLRKNLLLYVSDVSWSFPRVVENNPVVSYIPIITWSNK